MVKKQTEKDKEKRTYYRFKGTGFLLGIPARDLSEAEFKYYSTIYKPEVILRYYERVEGGE